MRQSQFLTIVLSVMSSVVVGAWDGYAQQSGDPLASKWLPVEGDANPSGATAAGTDAAGNPIYVCRVTMPGGDVWGGWFDGRCNTEPNLDPSSVVEVLSISPTAQWVAPKRGKAAPPHGVFSGKQGGRPVVVCRAEYEGGLYPGHLWRRECTRLGTTNGSSRTFEILVDPVSYERQRATLLKGRYMAAASQANGALERVPNPLTDVDTAQALKTMLVQAESNLKAQLSLLDPQMKSLSPRAYSQMSLFRKAKVASVLKRLTGAQQAVDRYLEEEQAKVWLDALESMVTDSADAADELEANDPGAVTLLTRLAGEKKKLAEAVKKLADIQTPKTHREAKARFRSLPTDLAAAIAKTEQHLPEKHRLAAYEKEIKAREKSDVAIGSTGYMRLIHWFKRTDTTATLAAVVDLWLGASFETAESVDAYLLEGGETNDEARTLAKRLRASHFKYKLVEMESQYEMEHVVEVDFDVQWAFGQLASWVPADVLARARCLRGFSDVTEKGVLAQLKACGTSLTDHSDSAIYAEWMISLKAQTEQRMKYMKAKQCNRVYRKVKKMAMGSFVKDICARLVAKEKRETKIENIYKRAHKQMAAGQFKAAKKTIYKMYDLKPPATERGKSFERVWESEFMRHHERKNKKKAIQRAQRLLRQFPAFERICKAQLHKQWRLRKRIDAAVRAGHSASANRLNRQFWAAGRKACDARAKVYDVVRIYRDQNNSMASNSARNNAPTCVREWRSCDR